MTSKIILITEGKKSSVDSIYHYLIEHGYEVLIANDSVDGFDLVRKEKPDLVLIDAVLSGFNGYQVCSLLKFDIKYEDIVVVILSDSDGNKYQKLAKSSGADGILVKPIDLNELMGIVKSLNLIE